MADAPVAGRAGGQPAVNPALGQGGLGKSQRTDRWWIEWLSVSGGLLILGAYATWAAMQGPLNPGDPIHPFIAPGTPYLSPFNSPEFLLWRSHPAFVPAGVIALLAILGFRGTCYYYRKAYYRAFFADPPGCAVGEGRSSYCGETRFPFLIQNAHRYFMYLALFAAAFLWADVVHSFDWDGHFGMRLGSLLMLVNVTLITGYTLGCHSIRHLIGGGSNCMSCSMGQAKAWTVASMFNSKHQQWAWASLISVCATDLYIRLVGTGVIHDPRFF
jgi:hypothetical protein